MDEDLKAAIAASIEKRKAIIEQEKSAGFCGKISRYFTKESTIEFLTTVATSILGSLICLKLCGLI